MRTAKIIMILPLVLSLCVALSCGDDDSSSEASAKEDDDDDDTSQADDDINDDADDDVNDDADDDDYPDDYVASWPQVVVEPRDYDETPGAGYLRQKVEEYTDFNEEWFHPYYGSMVGKVIFTDENLTEVAGYNWLEDSTLWTSAYMASQAMRYYVTGETEAQENAVAMVQALERHLRVTGRQGFLSRYVAPQDGLYYVSHGGDEWCDGEVRCHHVEEGEYAGDWWKGETSRDQYIGYFFGMSIAYDLLDDEDARVTIASNVSEVLDELIEHGWFIFDVTGLPSMSAPNFYAIFKLAMSLVGYHMIGEDRYKEQVQKWIADSRRDIIRLGNVNFQRYGGYFPNNLSHMNMHTLLRLAKVYLSPADHDFLVELFETQTHTFTRLSHNAFFNLIFMSQGRYDPAEAEYQAQLEQDLMEFREPPHTEFYLDPPEGVIDPISVLLKELIALYPTLEYAFGNVKLQSMEAHPVPEQCSTDFLWQRNPFRIEPCGADHPNQAMNGTDYILAYWMASYYKFIIKTD